MAIVPIQAFRRAGDWFASHHIRVLHGCAATFLATPDRQLGEALQRHLGREIRQSEMESPPNRGLTA